MVVVEGNRVEGKSGGTVRAETKQLWVRQRSSARSAGCETIQHSGSVSFFSASSLSLRWRKEEEAGWKEDTRHNRRRQGRMPAATSACSSRARFLTGSGGRHSFFSFLSSYSSSSSSSSSVSVSVSSSSFLYHKACHTCESSSISTSRRASSMSTCTVIPRGSVVSFSCGWSSSSLSGRGKRGRVVLSCVVVVMVGMVVEVLSFASSSREAFVGVEIVYEAA